MKINQILRQNLLQDDCHTLRTDGVTSYHQQQQAVTVYTQEQPCPAHSIIHKSPQQQPLTTNPAVYVCRIASMSIKRIWMRDGFFTNLQLIWEQGRDWFSQSLTIQLTHRTLPSRTVGATIGLTNTHHYH